MEAASGARVSFLASDPSIKCDTDDPEYWLLWRTAICFIGTTTSDFDVCQDWIKK